MRNLAFGLCAVLLLAGRLYASPTGLHAVSVSSESVSFAWDFSADIPEVQLSTSYPSFDNPTGGTLGFGETSATFHGLLSNTVYYFRVKLPTDPDFSGIVGVSSATNPSIPASPSFTSVGISSITVAWQPGNNSPFTQYLCETSLADSYWTSQVSVGVSTEAVFTGLNPDSTYYFRIKALGYSGTDSAFTAFASTPITLADTPTDGYYPSVSSTSLYVSWDPHENPDWTNYELQISSAFDFSYPQDQDISGPGSYYEITELAPNTTYYSRVWAINSYGIVTDTAVFDPTVTEAAVPGNVQALTAVANVADASWTDGGNPPDTFFYLEVSTAEDFTGADYGPHEWRMATDFTVGGLDAGHLYYFQVKARNRLGHETGYTLLGSLPIASGPDTTAPSVQDLQDGDDAWRGSASGSYMVHFTDFDSKLSRFEVRVATGLKFTGTPITDWTDVTTDINAEVYNTDWALPPAVFAAIPEGVTSYVSVRVRDNSGNVAVSSDVFYVLRDTDAPGITGSISNAPSGWLNSDPGLLYAGLTFSDALSGLSLVRYSASDHANATTDSWVTVTSFVSSATCAAPWGVNFGTLHDGVTNYISIEAVDNAGNAYIRRDVLRLLKDTVGPNVVLVSPGGPFISTITAFTGTASALNAESPVAYAAISLQDLTDPSSSYYNGTGFSSPGEVWLPAGGQASWSFDVSTIAFSAARQYKVRASAWDTHGLATQTPPSVSFRFDSAAPSVGVSTPVAGSTVTAFDAVSGTAADSGGAGLAEADVYIQRLYDSKWWNFATNTWGATPVASATVAGAAWNFTPGLMLRGNLADGQQYFVTARAVDAALPANGSGFAAPGATFTFTDSVPPQAAAQFTASKGTSPGRIELSWVFPGDDGLGLPIPFGRFAVKYSTFAGAVFSTQTAQETPALGLTLAGSTLTYTLAGLVPDSTYYLKLWMCDDAGLWSAPSPLVSTTAGASLDDQISGTIETPSGAGVTGVLVEAYDSSGVLRSEAYTLDDGLGTFNLTGLADGFYRVQATWVEAGFASSIAKDLIPMGYADVQFKLSVDYQLAAISGTVPLSAGPGTRPAASRGGEVQLWRGTRRLVTARPDAAGRFSIRNLIAGSYTLKVSDAAGVWHNCDVKLAGGQTLEVNPLGTLLDKASVYAYPNPARSSVKFHAVTDIAPARVEISVFSEDGALVKRIEEPAAHVNDLVWNFPGGKPASGVYFYTVRLRNENNGKTESVTRKFAVVR